MDTFLKKYKSKIYTYPLVHRNTFSKHYACRDNGEVLTNERLRRHMSDRIKVFRPFDLKGKDVLEIGGNLASYLYFVECKNIDSVDTDLGITLTNNLIKEKIERKCENINFHMTIPDKHYDFCFILSTLYRDGRRYTISDYDEILNLNVDRFVFLENEYNSQIFQDKELSVIEIRDARLYVI